MFNKERFYLIYDEVLKSYENVKPRISKDESYNAFKKHLKLIGGFSSKNETVYVYSFGPILNRLDEIFLKKFHQKLNSEIVFVNPASILNPFASWPIFSAYQKSNSND